MPCSPLYKSSLKAENIGLWGGQGDPKARNTEVQIWVTRDGKQLFFQIDLVTETEAMNRCPEHSAHFKALLGTEGTPGSLLPRARALACCVAFPRKT